MWDVWDVGCLECEMLGMWVVQDVECWGCGMFGMWNVRDVECSENGMWDVSWGVGTPSPSLLIYRLLEV